MKVVDLADGVWRDLGEPTDTSVAPIAYWFRHNIGQLNTSIGGRYYVDSSTQDIYYLDYSVDPINGTPTELDDDAAAIYKLIYIVHYYDMQIRKNIISFTASPVIQVNSDGHDVRMVSPTEVGKALAMFRKDVVKDLRDWIHWYRMRKTTPLQVTGDDTIEGPIESRPIYRRTYNLWSALG